MQKVKVAFFAEILLEEKDGASRTMFQLIRRIPQQQFEFLFVYGDGPKQLLNYSSVKVPALTIPNNKNYTLSIPVLARQLKKQLDAFNPDIVHIATPSFLGHFALKYAREQHIPVVSIYHTHFVSYIDYYCKHLPFLVRPIKKYLTSKSRKFYNRCDFIYIPSKSIKTELINQGIHSSKMQIWERGIDCKLFNPTKRDPNLLREITGNDLPNILFASRLVWEKNLKTLFRIYQLIKLNAIACNFIVVGDGIARKSCEREMKGAFFLGQLNHEKLATIYASSTIFVFPSISETYGNVVAEAMASGLPCIIAAAGGSKDLIEHAIDGFSCTPDKENEYVARIRTLLENKTLYSKFQVLGLEKSKKLNWDTLANTYFTDIANLGNILPTHKVTS
ncbi:glycosyltransferase family 1 protein [Olivibacter sp. SDN3]|uniref:glycosyltransferase family 4 protein n=1 Tax=Olivibacter sp. SDN3 TaxID=2764720 RepID=UPI001650F7B9|nr:glycosyltransferase family 1 protein [Olivibacter sp. SDN3]QNL49462.1 glycosyltransferase family 1 protein [Olivibacter sp. SDN3]